MEPFENTAQPDWEWWGRLWPTPAETLRDLGLSAGDSVVEIGSGNGYFAIPAARVVEPAPVYAVDLDAELLAAVRELAAQQALENVTAIQGDARELAAILEEPIDVALLANTFHGIDEPAGFLGQVADVLAPGGRFVVINWHDRPRIETPLLGEPRGPPTGLRLSPDDAIARITDGGPFILDRRVELPPYHYGLVFERGAGRT